MQDRHADREQYFREQGITTEKFVIPYIEQIKKISDDSKILEVGCGEGGNLLPFLNKGCLVTGIDISAEQIRLAQKYFQDHPQRNRLNLISSDIYEVKPSDLPAFDIIFLRDVIEHIPDQARFMKYIQQFMAPDAVLFFGFPPWRMPFGGHQQVCRSKYLSKLPYFHLLPNFLYMGLCKFFGESKALMDALLEVKETGISIRRFHQCIHHAQFQILKESHYFINPNYETKFGLKPRLLKSWLRIPWLSDFYTTAVYSLVGKKTI
ncbi:MAG: class I SAM-dependent methyltransferase [Saprospiraceae bacterium]|nr:class I SAM-dependent methyltransferase [Saprospiraceae bacterium]